MPAESERLGKYVLRERIGQGGMAEVWRATLPGAGGIDKPCVLKRILSDYATESLFVRMFLAEARLSMALQHGNIVQVFDFGESGGSYYLAMEHVRGPDLRTVLKRTRQRGLETPLSVALWIGMEVCRALAYAHAKVSDDGQPLGIVHRDVSPTNILLSFEGEVKLADFGIARARSSSRLTGVGMVKGKVGYMSPEQAAGDELDGRSDLFALGVVLHVLLTGHKPYEPADPFDVLEWLRTLKEAPSARALRPELAEDVDAIVRRALDPRPEGRFADAHQMQAELSAALFKYAPRTTSADLRAHLATLFPEEAHPWSAPREEDAEPEGDPTDPDKPVAGSATSIMEDLRSTVRDRPVPAALVPPVVPSESTPRPATPPARPRSSSALGAVVLFAGLVTATIGGIFAYRTRIDPSHGATNTVVVTASAPGAVATPPAVPRRPVTPPPAPSVAPAPPESTAIPPADDDEATPPPSPPAPTARIDVAAIPWAKVFVDGRLRGTTPTAVRVPAGRHTIRLVNPELSVEHSESVVVRAGQTLRIARQLR